MSPDNIDPEGHQLSEAYQLIQLGTQRLLVSLQSIQIDDKGVYQILTGKCRPADGPQDVLIIGDSFYGPDVLQVLPEAQTVGPMDKITIRVMCVDPPRLLHKGTTIAQGFLLPDHAKTIPENPVAF